MSEKFQEGQVLEGKVTGIQPYGAFVALDEKVQGLVHISEVTHGYVKDINEHLSEGDEVQVKILNIDEKSNKYSLSIRATQEAPKAAPRRPRKQAAAPKHEESTAGFNTLKDKLEDWIKQSDDREKFRK
ncbi:S1 domain-containing post-transcriptional regulator GSP13 [Halobacillus sp. ACCC02827]|uniref:S1 domain-containing post-transcriptional regulator GSP13 n=1 Tax=Bacillaceae TaxID=186817 RepID=UPI0002A5208D|nr:MULTISPECIES: S1 domain-containing post-transcriptional regulator GSP13 [Bacillaceae]ELK45941.1 general stress protein 13 [Halobacillus sp. BAB-2008]QHT47502.1 general stress protein 13 [Bacillus sp. SB49]WJE14732.1 S1 domain-containing post-transcriptional regulator GSP13 [Halobacillus sp. ACCC02827]